MLGNQREPPDYRVPLQDLQGVPHLGIEPRQHQAVDAADSHSLRRFAPDDIELMSKDKNSSLQCYP
jgi:hypothetical protein